MALRQRRHNKYGSSSGNSGSAFDAAASSALLALQYGDTFRDRIGRRAAGRAVPDIFEMEYPDEEPLAPQAPYPGAPSAPMRSGGGTPFSGSEPPRPMSPMSPEMGGQSDLPQAGAAGPVRAGPMPSAGAAPSSGSAAPGGGAVPDFGLPSFDGIGGGISLGQAVSAIRRRNPTLTPLQLMSAVEEIKPLLDNDSKTQLATVRAQTGIAREGRLGYGMMRRLDQGDRRLNQQQDAEFGRNDRFDRRFFQNDRFHKDRMSLGWGNLGERRRGNLVREDQGQQRIDQGEIRLDQADTRLDQGQQRVDNQAGQADRRMTEAERRNRTSEAQRGRQLDQGDTRNTIAQQRADQAGARGSITKTPSLNQRLSEAYATYQREMQMAEDAATPVDRAELRMAAERKYQKAKADLRTRDVPGATQIASDIRDIDDLAPNLELIRELVRGDPRTVGALGRKNRLIGNLLAQAGIDPEAPELDASKVNALAGRIRPQLTSLLSRSKQYGKAKIDEIDKILDPQTWTGAQPQTIEKLDFLLTDLRNMRERRETEMRGGAIDGSGESGGSGGSEYKDGDVIVNKKTGERKVRKGGKWVPLKDNAR